MTRLEGVWMVSRAMALSLCALGLSGCQSRSGGDRDGDGTVNTPGPDLTLACTGQGSITVTPPGIVYLAANMPVSIAYNSGDQVTVQAMADAGWQFSGWQGVLTGTTNPATLTMLGDTTLTAVFTGGGGGGNENENDNINEGAAIEGQVKDVAAASLAGVQVTSGESTTLTGDDGTFRLDAPAGLDECTVVFSRSGYVTSARRAEVASGATTHLSVVMKAMGAAQTMDASAGGVVTGERSSSITAPPNAFVDPAGQAVTGPVEVFLTPYDPAVREEFLAYPGELRGVTTNGEAVQLYTFGVLDVTVQQNGTDLQIKAGQTVSLRVPAPSAGPKPPTVQMWRFDVASNQWLQSDQGDATYDDVTDAYVAAVGHLSPFNCDRVVTATCIRGLVQDVEGNPVGGGFVQAIPAGGGFVSSDYTNQDGSYCLYVTRNVEMDIVVYTPLSASCPDELSDGPYCVTTYRGFHSGTRLTSEMYPGDCTSPECTQLPTITTGDINAGPVVDAECLTDTATNPFDGTCATGFFDLYECYAPEGKCTYAYDYDWSGGGGDFSYEMEFENGSRFECGTSVWSGYECKFYGPTGQLCGTYTIEDNEITMTTASGSSYTIRTTSSGDMVIECPAGSVTVTKEQLDFMNGCTGTTEEGSGVVCEAREGTWGADCTFGSECEGSGLDCCGSAWGEKTCQPSFVCDIMCETDAECQNPERCGVWWSRCVCCPSGQYSTCVPIDSCQ